MKQLWQYFLRGVITLLPFGLTIYVLYVFLAFSEEFFSYVIAWALGEYYIPGMGLLTGIVLICILGVLVSQKHSARFFSFLEMPFKNVPIVKSIYAAVKNL